MGFGIIVTTQCDSFVLLNTQSEKKEQRVTSATVNDIKWWKNCHIQLKMN